ncbi:hypothetical protein [Pedobacter sp. P26]|uniref:hypothetical protein n=1 Tax=Pedobacter sp. P26 TaxID=3423956 RepID=UPI003D67BDB5
MEISCSSTWEDTVLLFTLLRYAPCSFRSGLLAQPAILSGVAGRREFVYKNEFRLLHHPALNSSTSLMELNLIEADTGKVLKACRRMSEKQDEH